MEMVFFSKDLAYGDRKDVGLITLWTPKTKYETLKSLYGVCGNLYSTYGIGILIRNVLASPHLAHLIVTGKPNPSHKRTDVLNDLHSIASELHLSSRDIDDFYKTVTIIDCVSLSLKETANVLQDLPLTENVREPRIVPLPTSDTSSFPTWRSGHLVRSGDIQTAHQKLLREIRMFGTETKPDDRGHYRQELWQLTVSLDMSTKIRDVLPYKKEEIETYGECLWNGDEPEEVTYRYGYTLRHKYGDQIECMLDAFRKKRETFRTVLTLWEPLQSMIRVDEPCLTTIHPRIRQDACGDVLDMFCYIRTNDMWMGWPMNAGGLRYLQERIVQEIGDVKIGELTITSGSAHLYSYDTPAVDLYLDSIDRHDIIEFDAKGDWRVYKEDQMFKAEHYKDGLLLQTLTASTKKNLILQMKPFISDASHGLHLGMEIEKL